MKQDNRGLVITGPREIAKLERFVEEICEYCNVNNDYFGNILMATTEAANILFSLNGSDETTKIAINFDRNQKGLIFKIKLEDGLHQDDAETEDFLDKEIRRYKLAKNLYIIKSLADEVTISVNAKSIVLIFYVSSMNFEKSLFRMNKLKEYWVQKENVIQKR